MNLEQEVQNIKERNQKVEIDKAWERSYTRRLTIAVITYIVAYAWLVMIAEPLVALKAFVPVAGYILSTLSLPIIKTLWIKSGLKSQLKNQK
jgi:uncharacterized membrane protein YkgB